MPRLLIAQLGATFSRLTEAAADDPLLRGLPSPLAVQATHKQSVLALPDPLGHVEPDLLDLRGYLDVLTQEEPNPGRQRLELRGGR